MIAPYNWEGSTFHLLDGSREQDILAELDAECLDSSGQLKVMPASFYARWPRDELMLWSVRRGLYCLPTLELVDFIRDLIDCDDSLEIGAGNGCLGRSVGIPMTDSYQQERPDVKALYESLNQDVIKYGPDVERLTALEAVEKYRPTVVLAAWVTHRWSRDRPHARGNMHGVDEGRLLEKKFVKRYIFVGNENVHVDQAPKPILSRRHETHRLPFVFSRSADPRDVVWVWRR